jgi:hypothetical protein
VSCSQTTITRSDQRISSKTARLIAKYQSLSTVEAKYTLLQGLDVPSLGFTDCMAVYGKLDPYSPVVIQKSRHALLMRAFTLAQNDREKLLFLNQEIFRPLKDAWGDIGKDKQLEAIILPTIDKRIIQLSDYRSPVGRASLCEIWNRDPEFDAAALNVPFEGTNLNKKLFKVCQAHTEE